MFPSKYDYTNLMEPNRCKICLKPAKNGDGLCYVHKKVYVLDESIEGYRLRKRGNGSSTRYIQKKFHQHEICLTKLIEQFYGPKNVVTGFHPLWAISTKGALLEYDIYIPEKRLLIEYNGEQHYQFTPCFHKNKTRFILQQRRDKRKARLANKNKYILIIFKYDEPLIKDYVINKIEKTKHDLNEFNKKQETNTWNK
jgi:hypothetical protein